MLFPANEATWTFLDGKTEQGLPMMLRFRDIDPGEEVRERFRFLVSILWEYTSENSMKVPTEATLDEMDVFEERFFDASDAAASWGTCLAVKTFNGAREWRCYTPDFETFTEEFNAAIEGVGPFPLKFQVLEDPEWKGLAEYRDLVAED